MSQRWGLSSDLRDTETVHGRGETGLEQDIRLKERDVRMWPHSGKRCRQLTKRSRSQKKKMWTRGGHVRVTRKSFLRKRGRSCDMYDPANLDAK